MRLHNLALFCTTWASFVLPAHADDAQPQLHLGAKPAEVMFAKITVSNLRKSFDFYTNVIGLKQVGSQGQKPDLDAPIIHICLNFSGSLADPFLCLNKEKGVVPAEYAKLIYIGIKTPDARATVNRVKAAGLPVPIEPTLFMGDVAALVNDPDGYSLQIVEAPSV